MSVKLRVNGQAHELEVDPETPLLWVLRDHLGLSGTKYGCGVAQCGACTVHVDGAPRRACVAPIGSLAGRQVTTIEGASGPHAEAVRATWEGLDVPQCGYCQAGQVMSAIALLERVPTPSDQDIDHAMSGNICRCATYVRIRRAIHSAAASIGGQAGQAEASEAEEER
ncbi:Isoquinoline 1-oxidoreductase alpha subunit [Enhygromyxa salina]|uniref:Isoquinoline 1-oxidoreductase alpha subunit n=1 Tax=Enhygromyxa salina TaxID=215803 RepID=A0A0C2DCD7_9BACT|nr:(2Fe-2S)-binding protein [Enhygromyxa salina]KIG19105.1 Isoquinoline 1-oxidoreductase alpha subunit [Enhygromyxa salina]